MRGGFSNTVLFCNFVLNKVKLVFPSMPTEVHIQNQDLTAMSAVSAFQEKLL